MVGAHTFAPKCDVHQRVPSSNSYPMDRGRKNARKKAPVFQLGCSQPCGSFALSSFLVGSVGVPFNPLRVKLLTGDLATAQFGMCPKGDCDFCSYLLVW